MRENSRTKGQRLVAEGRLKISWVDNTMILASCRGDTGIHTVGHEHDRSWYCTCEARGRCSHLVALQLVTGPRRVKEAA